MPAPGFPLPLRNALAAIAIDGLDDDDARAALTWLAGDADAPGDAASARLVGAHLVDPGSSALLAVHAPWEPAIRAHATRALRAAAAPRPPASGAAVTDAVGRAAVLWNEQLFFEVHEVLEAVWVRETGDVRQALQGLIQIAVAYHHLAHGNPRGARTLLREGRARLEATAHDLVPLLDRTALLDDTAVWQTALESDAPSPPGSTPPRLRLC
ncbi:MAG TPA: DUF309 domain-containing protein [Candidatus Binatia bacterium]|jgi:hypothetical protein|nr:DUF309 domain-containing protein [Candidatus Binatia bacterium]